MAGVRSIRKPQCISGVSGVNGAALLSADSPGDGIRESLEGVPESIRKPMPQLGSARSLSRR